MSATKFYSFTDDIVQKIEDTIVLLETSYHTEGKITDFKTYHQLSKRLSEVLNAYLVYRLPIARVEKDDRVKIVTTMAMNAIEMPEEFKPKVRITFDSGVKKWP